MTLFQSLSLIAAATLLLFFPESAFVFQVVVFGGALLTLHMFFRMVKDPELVRFGNIACFSILFGYVVSTAGYTIVNYVDHGEVTYIHNVFGLGYSRSIISYTMLTVLIVSVLLSVIANFEKPLHLTKYLEKSLSKQSLWLIVLSTFVMIIGFINEDIGYMGIYLVSERRISPFGALCFLVIPPLTAITIACLLSLPAKLRRYRKLLIVVSVCLVILIIPLGRRVLMYTTISTLILIGPTLFRNYRKRRIKFFNIICIALAIIVLFGWGFRSFYAMRISVNKMAFQNKPGVLKILPYTIDLMRDSYAMVELHEKLIENISQRPFILSYLAGLFEAHMDKNVPIFGELRHALAMSVPSLFYPEKTDRSVSASEDIIHPLLGLPVFDGPNTMLTSGLNDLGIIGILIYPIAIVGLYIFIFRLIPTNCPPFLSLFILLRLMYSLFCLEESLGAVVGSGLRDLAIVALVYWVILKMQAHKLPIAGFRRSGV